MDLNSKNWIFDESCTFDEVTKYFHQLELIKLTESITLDFTKVKQIDTSLLSFVLEIKRKSSPFPKPINFINLPKSFHTLAKLYGVESLFK